VTERICTGKKEDGTSCREIYDLPIPYEQANPIIRDLCPECIGRLQRDHDRESKKEIASQDWFSP
jgi:hypothetical protein